MVVLIILGLAFLCFGILLIFSPGSIKKLDEFGQKVLFKTKGNIIFRIVIGLFFLVAAYLMYYFAFIKGIVP